MFAAAADVTCTKSRRLALALRVGRCFGIFFLVARFLARFGKRGAERRQLLLRLVRTVRDLGRGFAQAVQQRVDSIGIGRSSWRRI
ncbi:hypothetical protein [uncultured Sphingomonas sp.]|uniref:hypothetical protein n=1 Tax=uncultured Sphingomonas sp. TaxID=158754 RepID=UPI0035C9508D